MTYIPMSQVETLHIEMLNSDEAGPHCSEITDVHQFCWVDEGLQPLRSRKSDSLTLDTTTELHFLSKPKEKPTFRNHLGVTFVVAITHPVLVSFYAISKKVPVSRTQTNQKGAFRTHHLRLNKSMVGLKLQQLRWDRFFYRSTPEACLTGLVEISKAKFQ